MINQAPIVRYTASVCEKFFSDFRKKTFSAESQSLQSFDFRPSFEFLLYMLILPSNNGENI